MKPSCLEAMVIELGLTFPLQRFLKQKTPDYGRQSDRRLCWDLHVISLRGAKSPLAVHSHSRYTFVLYGLSRPEWERLPDTFLWGLRQSLAALGFSRRQIEACLPAELAPVFTRTYGRREVAFLNRAWEDVLALDWTVDGSARAQPLLDRAVNGKPSRCVGEPGLGPAAEQFLSGLLQEG